MHGQVDLPREGLAAVPEAHEDGDREVLRESATEGAMRHLTWQSVAWSLGVHFIVLLALVLLLPCEVESNGNTVEFDKPSYTFTCSVGGAHNYFPIGLNMLGPNQPSWVYARLEYDHGLIIDPENVELGLQWLEPELVSVSAGTTEFAEYEHGVWALFESSTSIFAGPGHLCNWRYVWSRNEECYDGPIRVSVWWRNLSRPPSEACPPAYAWVHGTPSVGAPESTWGTIKALYR